MEYTINALKLLFVLHVDTVVRLVIVLQGTTAHNILA